MRTEGRKVLVVGAGIVGLFAALALARRSAGVTLVGSPTAPAPGRTIALFADTVRLLEEIGAWTALKPSASPIRALRVIDDTDNLFRWRPLTFAAREIGLDAFGYNVAADEVVRTLMRAARADPRIACVEGLASEPRFEAHAASSAFAGHGRVETSLIVAADGRNSPMRRAAGIAARTERMPQSALTALFDHDLGHNDASTEFHARGGPCTLVPLGERRSSLVWMVLHGEARRLAALADESFGRAVEARVHSILGAMRVVGGRAIIPLVSSQAQRFSAPRLVLIGEAAHAFPPIGAQGLNLGLRDADTIATLVGEALDEGCDIGGPALLDSYDSKRRFDVASRAAVVSLMNGSLLSTFLPTDVARGVGMAALDLIGPLRRLVMREGVAPGFRASAPKSPQR